MHRNVYHRGECGNTRTKPNMGMLGDLARSDEIRRETLNPTEASVKHKGVAESSEMRDDLAQSQGTHYEGMFV